ncbi:MAG: aspartate/glutamate racemase family protein [Sphaerochaeta sp.]|jgi:aspartate racemase|nr:aspartate/glutamate racemase family protein [Sphaerochaeta sp.]
MKIIGVLGGMGPEATVDFLGKLVRIAGPETCPRILVDMDPTIPSRTLAAMGKGPNPGGRIMQGVSALVERGAEIVAVPCNQAHGWHPANNDYRFGPESRWLDMLAVVAAAVKARGLKQPLILGGYVTTRWRLYDRHFGPYAICLNGEINEAVYRIIADIKRGGYKARDTYRNLVAIIRQARKFTRLDSVILACTELPLIWPVGKDGNPKPFLKLPVFDSSLEYARAIIAKAKQEGD